MPRKARIDYPGGVHHLIVRGITSDTTGGESGGGDGERVVIEKRPLKLKD